MKNRYYNRINMKNFYKILVALLLIPNFIYAKEMQCGEDSFPGSPADSNVRGHIYCLKSCGPKQGYIYLVQDTERHWGKNNDRARFKLVRSKFLATNKGPYGNQRVAQKGAALQCLVASRLTAAVNPVSVLADSSSSDKEKEKARLAISKIGVAIGSEATDVLEQILATVKGVECVGDDGLRFSTVSEVSNGGTVDGKKVSLSTKKSVTSFSLSETSGQERLQCQAKNNAAIVNQAANNLLSYRPVGAANPKKSDASQ